MDSSRTHEQASGVVDPREKHLALAGRLRSLREDAGLTGTELAERTKFSQSKISRIETGRVLPTPRDVQEIARAANVLPQETQLLIDDIKLIRSEYRSWKSLESTLSFEPQADVAQLEQSASKIESFLPFVVPGLLQTAAYARRILELATLGHFDKVDERVAARIERQAILYGPERRFNFVMLESALYHQYVPTDEMRAQLDRLRTVATLPNVELQIVPYAAALTALPQVAFHIYDGAVVTVELPSGQLEFRSAEEVSLYRELFDRLKAVAVVDGEALSLISRAMDIPEARRA